LKEPISTKKSNFLKILNPYAKPLWALSEAVDKIESGMLRKQYTLGVFLDIAGAFNNLSFESAISSMRDQKFPTTRLKYVYLVITRE
jgi:hypothetical protein